MRLAPGVLLTLCALSLPACAVVEPPSGGPEDKSPPRLLTSRPDTLAIVPNWRGPVTLVFDERVSERGVEQAVNVSPRTSTVVTDHRGDEIRVSLRQGWRPNTIYHVQVLPGLLDLFNNEVAEPIDLVFSTGPAIPDTWAEGEIVDPITGKPEEGARVEAIRAADSLVYAVPSDSAGRFRISRVPEGEYRLRAYRDMNRNRELDAFEPRDTAAATVTVGDTVRVRMAILMPDTTPPAVTTARVSGSTIEIQFDDYLAADQVLPPGRVQIVSASGQIAPVQRITIGQPAAAGAEERQPGGAPASAPRTPLPSQTLVVKLDEEVRLEPGGSYTIRILGIRNLSGLVGNAETVLEVPAAAGQPSTGAPSGR